MATETKRRPFNLDEIKTLLTHPSYISLNFKSSYSFWLIPIGLFSGGRLREICQLEIKDFVEIEGIPCFDINDIVESEIEAEVDGAKRLKNPNARRLVPIHSALIEMGLLRYVKTLRENGHLRLFPELNNSRRDGPGHAASSWFQRFRNKVGLENKQETVFHSFRHTFITTILDNDVSPHMLAPVVGHEADLITGQVYWNKKDASKRQPTVEQMKMPNEVLRMFPKIEDVFINQKLKK